MDKKLKAMQDQRSPTLRSLGDGIAAGIGWLRRKPRAYAASILRWPVPEQWIAIAVLTTGAAIVSMFLFDGAATLNSKRIPQSLIDAVNWFTDFGRSGWFLIPSALMVGVCALVGMSSKLTRMQHGVLAALAVRAQFVFIAIAIPGLIGAVLKRLIGRARPLMIDWHIPHPFSYSPFNNRGAFHSMPSGHAITAVCAAIILGAMWPKARPYLWIYAVAICMSRVILLSHHVSDVLMGALVGGFFAILIRDSFAARGLVFSIDQSGQMMPKPGPSWRRIKALAHAMLSK